MTPARLNELLRPTSRSFYLTLRVLPGRIRPQIGLAYLLARTSDTIADTDLIAVSQRLEALQQFRTALQQAKPLTLDFGPLAQQQASPAERELLLQTEVSLAALAELTPADHRLVREVLDTIISGQELDLQRFGGASREQIVALQNDADLDDYTYRVAGCVGKFWTHLCRAHISELHLPRTAPSEQMFTENGIRFGKGLQLVNILRDLPADLNQGRCYLPQDTLTAAGFEPADLLCVANEARFRPVYDRYLKIATDHLAAGWDYTNQIHHKHVRLRLACAWPILIGLETLQRLRSARVLDPAHRVKISRAEVRNLMLRTLLRYPFRSAWQRLAVFPR
jgi:farnesyl-diphosphate farnesyltransferase